MAWVNTGIITFRGDNGNPKANNKKKVEILGVTNNTALNILWYELGLHSKCNVAKGTWQMSLLLTDEAPDTDANIDKVAIIYFRDPDTMRVRKLHLPSPLDADIEETKEGQRVKKAIVTELVGHLSTACGKSFSPLYGIVIQKK